MVTNTNWYKGTSGWVQGTLSARTAYGWKHPIVFSQKTGVSTWTTLFGADLTPPAQPTLLVTQYASTTKVWFTLRVTAPSDADMAAVVVKISPTGYPSSPTINDANMNYNDASVTTLVMTPSQVYTMTADDGYQVSHTYYISTWAKDKTGNYSLVRNATAKTLAKVPTTVPKVLTTKTAYVTTVDSGSWDPSQHYWRTDNNYVYQGAPYNWYGYWFYGNKLASLLANSVSITKVSMEVHRLDNGHGVFGAANIEIGYHSMATQPASPSTINSFYNAIDLSPGQSSSFTITSAWYAGMKSGAARGFGMRYGTTTTSSSYYAQCYGYGTYSGRLTVTWKEYV